MSQLWAIAYCSSKHPLSGSGKPRGPQWARQRRHKGTVGCCRAAVLLAGAG